MGQPMTPKTAAPSPETARIPTIKARYGLSRSAIYRALSEGRIEAVKNGRQTLILVDSVERMIGALPKATFRRPAAEAEKRAA
jgi:hypothetical protein